MFVEYRKDDWKNYKTDTPYWFSFGEEINPGRNYFMFGALTNGVVRNRSNIKTKIDPRGLPGNLSYDTDYANKLYVCFGSEGENMCTKEMALKWNETYNSKLYYNSEGDIISVDCPDWHSHSWLTFKEYSEILKEAKRKVKKEGYGIGINYTIIEQIMKTYEKNGYQTRLVFWFDN